MVIIRTEKRTDELDFNVEIQVEENVISAVRKKEEFMGEIDLIEMIFFELSNIFSQSREKIIPFSYTRVFKLYDTDKCSFELNVKLIDDTFKGEVYMKL